jgi:CIC family chloride channel protein
LKLPREKLRVLVAAGAAAAIAGCFNTPIAGAMFALEIIVGDFALSAFSPVVIASVLGTVVHRSIHGSEPVFAGVHFELLSGYEIGLYVILGLFCGLVATVLVRSIEWGDLIVSRLSAIPAWLLPGLGLTLVVGFAIATNRFEILGSGHDAVQLMQANQIELTAVVMILVGKIVCTALTLATSGHIGGVFFPSIFIGAATGSVFGHCAQMLFHGQIASPGAYALIGMGAVVTAVIQAPLFGILMIFEMTNDYEIILPLMVSCILASLVSRHALQMSIYQRQLKDKGILLAR